MEKTDTRRLSSSAQEALRYRVMQAVLGGMKQTQAAEIFGVSRRSIITWLKAVRTDGEAALKSRKRGRPKGGLLKGWQAAWVVRQVRGKCPDQLRLPFMLWTREAVGALIARKFGLNLSLWTVGRYLHRWGFSPQKPMRRAYERNPAQVRYWLRDKYPAIRRQAREEGARIFWGDEMGLRSDHAVGRTWGLKGQTPVVKATGKRFGCNMISAITNQGNLNFMVFEGRFTADVFIEFMRRMIRQSPDRKVFLVVDRHPVHRSRKVEEWLADNKERILMFLLPGYSPELNPDELLNQDVKSNSVGRRRAKDKAELIKNVRGYLRGRQRMPALVSRFFQAEQVRYAA